MKKRAFANACIQRGLSFRRYSRLAKSQGYDLLSKGEYEEAEEEAEESEDDEEEDEESEEGEESEGMERADKSLAVGDLRKAMDAFDAVSDATQIAGGSRQSYLEARAQAGTITKSERTELGRLWSGEETDAGNTEYDSVMRKSVTQRIHEADPGSGELVDGSEFLKSLIDAVDDKLDDVMKSHRDETNTTRQSVAALGTLTKSLAQVSINLTETVDAIAHRLGAVERQPVVRKSVGADPRDIRVPSGHGGDSLVKGFGQGISKSQVFDALDSLIQKAAARGDNRLAQTIAEQSSKLEMGFDIDPKLVPYVQNEIHGR